MTAHLSRRTLLGAVPSLAAPMALLPASIAKAAAETPILRLYRQWLTAYAAFTGAPDDASDAFYAQITALEDRIEAQPVTSLEDLAAKAIATTGRGDFALPSAVIAECQSLLRDVEPLPLRTTPTDPLPGLLAQRARLEAEWLALPEGSVEAQAAWEAFLAAEQAIETTVATTPEGLSAQLAYIRASYCAPPHDAERPLSDEIPIAFLDVIAAGIRRIGQ